MFRRGRYALGSSSDPTQAGDSLETTAAGEVLSEVDANTPDVEAQEHDHNATLGEVDTVLAQAWMAKRREQLQMGGNSATAVDVDAVASWGVNPPIPQSSDYLSTKRVTFSELDAESSLSSHSIRTDKTPIVSNRMPGAPRRPLLLPQHPLAPTREQDLSCRDVFDIKKWHGKVLYALIFLLLLSIVTVVATATLTGGGSSKGSKSPVIFDDTNSSSAGNTFTPSISPSLNMGATVSLDSAPTVPATFSPTFSAVTLASSPPSPPRAPFSQPPTTSAPIGAITIGEPTAGPILSPQTLRPNTSAPSTSPAPTQTTAPSTQPSTSPSLSLAGLASNVEESFRFDHKASSIAISNNAQVVAISDSDNIIIYNRVGGTWEEQDSVPGGNGSEVALNGDGSVIAVSNPTETAPGGQEFSGMVRVYLRDFQQGYRLLGQELDIGSENSFFGAGLALSFTGRTIAVGAPFFSTSAQRRVGQARVYEYSAARNRWVPLGAPLFGNNAEDWFGTKLAIQEPKLGQPLIIAVSAPHSTTQSGYVQTYALRDIEWTQYGGRFSINNEDASGASPSSITDSFGVSISMVQTEESLRIAVGAPQKSSDRGQENTGMVVVYDYDRTLDQWILVGDPIVESTGAKLGSAVALANEGKLLIIGSAGHKDNRGVVRFYRYASTGFSSDDDALVEGDRPKGQFGSLLSATTGNGASQGLSLIVSSNERSEIVLLEEKT